MTREGGWMLIWGREVRMGRDYVVVVTFVCGGREPTN